MSTSPDDRTNLADDDLLDFGPFRLDRSRRTLLSDGARVRLGSRALEILLVLTERVGTVVSNRELLRRVWPDNVIEEGTLRVQIAMLRKVLRDGESGADYIQTTTGRGYCFVGSTSRQQASGSSATVVHLPVRQLMRVTVNSLPRLLNPLFGRAQAIREVAEQLAKERFVTITGPGGSGKTTVAVHVAESLCPAHASNTCFVDLAGVTDPQLVPTRLATALGLPAFSVEPLPKILSSLSGRSMLLVLDNCEHLIEAAARLAESVLRGARDVQILATSREPMRATMESLYRIGPLETPPAPYRAPRREWLDFPAIRLFADQARKYSDTELEDDELPLAADICRRLEGNPLAIEIAASQLSLLGMRALSASLEQDLCLSINGRRTAVPRHQSLRASLDWSYDLLSPAEQTLFRRLSVFTSSFDLDSAAAVMASENQNATMVFVNLIELTRKSLIVTEPAAERLLYRLPDLQRAYAREKLYRSDEVTLVRRTFGPAPTWRPPEIPRVWALEPPYHGRVQDPL